jgi:hypothetical protein
MFVPVVFSMVHKKRDDFAEAERLSFEGYPRAAE